MRISTWASRAVWLALGLVTLLVVVVGVGELSQSSGDADGDGFEDSASPPTIQLVRPADKSRFPVAAPIEAEFRLDGGRGMTPNLLVVSLKRGDVIVTQTTAGDDATPLHRATFEKGLAAPGNYRLVVEGYMRPTNVRSLLSKKRYRPIKIESAVDIEVTR